MIMSIMYHGPMTSSPTQEGNRAVLKKIYSRHLRSPIIQATEYTGSKSMKHISLWNTKIISLKNVKEKHLIWKLHKFS